MLEVPDQTDLSFAVRPHYEEYRSRLPDVYTPAGLENWFVELARLTSGAQPPTLEQLLEAGRRYDTIFMPESAPSLMQKYGLKMAIPNPEPSRP